MQRAIPKSFCPYLGNGWAESFDFDIAVELGEWAIKAVSGPK
jgi:hypothetical protein